MADEKPKGRGVPKARGEARTQPGRNGGTLNVGGNHGGGRPPDEFKRRMREIASNDEALAFLEACAAGKHGPQFAIKAQEYAAERGYGRELQPIGGPDGGPIETHEVTDAELLERASKIRNRLALIPGMSPNGNGKNGKH